MAESEDENLTILSSWAPKAYQCFAAEFEELTHLKQQHEEVDREAQHELEARCRAEVDLQIRRDYPDVNPLLPNASSTPWAAGAAPATPLPQSNAAVSAAGGSATKRLKNKQAQQQLQAEVAMVTAKREMLLQQHLQAALAAQDRQPARRLAARYTRQLTTTQKQVKAHLEREAHELQRFSSRPLASYALGEVLDAAQITKPGSTTVLLTSPATSPTKRPAAAPPVQRDGGAGASSASRAGSERGSTRSSRLKKPDSRAPVRGGKGGANGSGTTSNGTRPRPHSGGSRKLGTPTSDLSVRGEPHVPDTARPPPFLIDAHQFAVEYNEMLKKEYGYRPAMTNAFPAAADSSRGARGADEEGDLHVSASASSATDAERSQQEKLRTHAPGLTTKRAAAADGPSGEGYNAMGWLPPIHATARQDFTATGSPLKDPGNAVGDARERTQQFAHSSPALGRPEKNTGKGIKAGADRTSGGAVKSSTAARGAKVAVGPPAANPLHGIDCMAKDSGVSFSACVGHPMRHTLRFVNRNAYRTRLRLKASDHPWLTYRCTRIAPAAGSNAATSGTAVPPETPLNCGGFVEVEVVFAPQSIEGSTAALEAVLEMGVARELNDRSSEGAQWQFMRIPIHGEVVLPHFEWWRRRDEEGMKAGDTSQHNTGADTLVLSQDNVEIAAPAEVPAATQLVSHASLLACATPLDGSSSGGGAVVGFGDVLVLGRMRQTLYLENTGSEAVVNLLSSSPEFSVSLVPAVATTLPPLQAVELVVTFCPLKEGFCEASLTVAVRASNDPASAVLAEHTVALHGTGVVPRVSISSLGMQVVQERALRQWQVSPSEAPLHTILKETMPGVPAEVVVTVSNHCAVPLAFHWEGDSDVPHSEARRGQDESSGDSGSEEADKAASTDATSSSLTKVATLSAKSFIAPSVGVLPAFSTSAFVLTVTPATLQPLQTLNNLFLDDIPDPAAAENVEKLSFVDAEVLEFYQRSRLIPCTVPQQQEAEEALSAAGTTEAALQVTYLDPVTAFTRFRRSPAEGQDGAVAADEADAFAQPFNGGVFATSFLTYQQPAMPSLTIAPAVVEERVECLLRCRQTRTVTLHNSAPVALHFVLDPTEAEFAASLRQPSFLSNLYGTSEAAPLLRPTTSTFERWRGFFPVSDGIAVQCQPRKGVVPARGAVTVTVHFTVEACGPHYAVVPCWIPEVEQLRALLATAGPALRTTPASRQQSFSRPSSPRGARLQRSGSAGPMPASRRPSERRPGGGGAATGNTVTTLSRSPAEDALRIIEEGGCYAVNVTATGVGATVKASTDLLDFGLIELGQEAAASFTVSNPNLIPVVFDLCDPLMRHPPRFVFIPESFRLGAGNTVEVTVYRKAVSTEDAQTFFELTVRDGGASVAIETRATIQQPLLVVDTPVVQYGVVPEGVWQTGTFHVSNRSAIDTDFALTPATPLPPYIEVEYERDYVLRAGEQLDVPVRCRFFAVDASPSPTRGRGNPGGGCGASALAPETSSVKQRATAAGCYSTLLCLVSKRSRQTLLIEVCCDAIEKLSVSVDVVPRGDASGGAVLPPMTAAAYVRALLMNALEAALSVNEHTATEATHRDVTQDSASRVDGGGGEEGEGVVTLPYCCPARLVDTMPDDLPLSRQVLDIVVQSYTGGEAMYAAAAHRYAPQPMESVGAQGIVEKKRAIAKAASRSGTRAHGADANDASSVVLTNVAARDEATVVLPAFWTATVNGGATALQAQRQIVEAAQKVLGDGSGCVTLLSSVAGVLHPHGTVRIPVNLWCALPGRYLEHLCVRADASLPLLRIPVEYEVYGKPIVLDATTSGLTKDGGREGEDVLLMPPVIAPLGTSRRTIRLINRVSRDMDVTVDVFPCPLGMAVHAIDPDAPADKVELKLLTMTAEDKEREGARVGRVTAVPFKLCIPAHARREVVLEFTPNTRLSETDPADGDAATSQSRLGLSKEGSNTAGAAGVARDGNGDDDDGDEEAMLPPAERWWQGSVCINAVLAQTEANDIFLVDEFYTIHAARYPSRRVARPLTGMQSAADSAGGGGNAAAPQVKVLRPLRTRPNDRVVRRGRIVWPTEAEQRILDRHASSQAAAAAALQSSVGEGLFLSASKMAKVASSDDDDDAVLDTPSFRPASVAQKNSDGTSTAVPSLEALLKEAEEREELLRFVSARRRTLQVEGNKYFTSIELRLRARCGRPHLTIEPSERGVEFPAVPQTEPSFLEASPSSAASHCTRTMRVTNRNSAPLRFALSFVTPASESNAGVSTPALFSIVRCARWQSGHDEADLLFTASPAADAEAAAEESEGHVYTLDSMDALDVTVVAQTGSAAWRQHVLQRCRDPLASKEAVEGVLKVQFLPTSATSTATQSRDIPAQLLPLRVPLTKPSIECRPGVVWFRPGQQRHDGRPQVAYTQTFTLYNASRVSARFRVLPVATDPTAHDDVCGEAIGAFQAQQRRQLQRSVMAASFSTAVAGDLFAANTTTTTVGVAGAETHHTISHKVREVVRMPATAPPAEGRSDLVYVDDPTQFTIVPAEGLLPPASLGGEPGEVQLRVDFREFSSIRYETLFAVVVDGDPSVPPTYVVVRGDSRDTEL